MTKFKFKDKIKFMPDKEYTLDEILSRYPMTEVKLVVIVKAKNGKELQQGESIDVRNK